MLHTLLLSLQRSGYVSSVAIGGPEPPAPSAVNPTLSQLHIHDRASAWSANPYVKSGKVGEGEGEDAIRVLLDAESAAQSDEARRTDRGPAITQENVATRRLWVGLKYWNNEPVLRGMNMVSKPTRRVWMGVPELMELTRGNQKGYVKGLRGIGESMYVTTDRGIMEVRECVERKTGGMLLCRVNPY